MRVLEVFGEPIADGGQESFVFGVIDKIDMDNLHIDCLTAYDCRSERYRNLLKEKGGRIYSLKLPFTPGKSRANIIAPFRRFLKKYKYEIVHIHSGSISVLAIMAAVAHNEGVRKVIVHSHCTGDKDNIKHKMIRFLASLIMGRNVDIYCACSKEAAQWKFEKKYAANTIIVKNGIELKKYSFDLEKRRIWRAKLGFSNDNIVIGHVGRFCYQKNQTFLVELLEKLLEDSNEYRLLLVGDGDDRKEVERMAAERGLDQKVVFAGSVDNVEDYLQAMDVFAFPSRFEGLGIVAIEAQANGLSVIASEAVPRDAAVSPHMVFIKQNIEAWTRQVKAYETIGRTDNKELLYDHGYDVEETAKRIRSLYTI